MRWLEAWWSSFGSGSDSMVAVLRCSTGPVAPKAVPERLVASTTCWTLCRRVRSSGRSSAVVAVTIMLISVRQDARRGLHCKQCYRRFEHGRCCSKIRYVGGAGYCSVLLVYSAAVVERLIYEQL